MYPQTVNLMAIFSTELVGIIALMTVWFSTAVLRTKTERKDLLTFKTIFYVALLGCIIDCAASVLDGMPGFVNRIALYLGDSYQFALDAWMGTLLVAFIEYHLFGDNRESKQIIRFFCVGAILLTLLLLINVPTGIVFQIDEANVYHRGLCAYVYAVYIFAAFLFSVREYYRYKKISGTVRFFPIGVFLIPATFGALFQLAFYGTAMINPTLAIAISGAALSLQNEAAYLDVLTGILNRQGFVRFANEHLHQNADGQCMAAIIDIDDFKFINDFYGHNVGDVALQRLANDLTNFFGAANIVGRTGGDEFCVMIKNLSSKDAEKKIREFSKEEHYIKVGDQRHSFTISIGYAEYPRQAQDRSSLFNRADAALYNVKLHGKHGCQRYENGMIKQERASLGFSLRDIADNVPGAILVYQAEGDEKILFANDILIQMFECQDLDDFMKFTKGSFKGIVHPDDLKPVEYSIWKQIGAPQNKSIDYVEYRIVTKTGKVKYIEDYGRLVKNERYGYIFYVLMTDVEERHKRKED